MKLFFCLVFLILSTSCSVQKKISKIALQKQELISKIKYDLSDIGELSVAYSLSNFSDEKNKEIDTKINDFLKIKTYNRLIYCVYIIKQLNQTELINDNSINYFLEQEKDNSFAFYLAAMLYFNNGNNEKADALMKKGNNIIRFDDFENDFRTLQARIINKYTNEINVPIPIILNQTFITYLNHFKNSKIQELVEINVIDKNEYLKMSKKIELNSTYIINKRIGLVMQKMVLDKKSQEYNELNNQLNLYIGLSKFLRNYEWANIESYFDFSRDLIKSGEFEACLRLFAKN